jgi:hypothetical protein
MDELANDTAPAAVYLIAEIRYTARVSGTVIEETVIDPDRGFFVSADAAIEAVWTLNRVHTEAFDDYRRQAILAGQPVQDPTVWFADRGFVVYKVIRIFCAVPVGR